MEIGSLGSNPRVCCALKYARIRTDSKRKYRPCLDLSPYEQHQHSTRQPQGHVASDSKLQFAGVDSWPPDTAYSLGDNYQHTRLSYQLALDSAYLLMIVQSIPDSPVTIVYLSTIVAYKFTHRLLVFKLVTKSWNLNKMVADYMYEEHEERIIVRSRWIERLSLPS
ncbi:hypothetical protein EJB05_13791, partial [Eragrostis curvula]